MVKKRAKKRIFNRHFIGMISIFVVVIVTVLTFVSFIEEALHQDRELNNAKKENRK